MATFVQLAEVKEYLQMTKDTDDVELQRFIDAGCKAVERYKGRVLGQESFTDVFSLDFPGVAVLQLTHTPILSVESVENDETAWLNYKIRHALGKIIAVDDVFEGDVEVVYTAGYEEVPADWVHATLVLVKHLWDTQRRSSLSPRNTDEGYNPMQATSWPYRVRELLGARSVAVA